jgi:hypothetical protein
MATKGSVVKAKGTFNLESMSVTEYSKDGDITGVHYLQDLFQEFDGKNMNLNVSGQDDIAPASFEE